MRKYIFSLLGILLVALLTFSFGLQPSLSIWAEEDPPIVKEAEPIKNDKDLWGFIKEGVKDITGAIGESISQLVSKFVTATADFFLSTICPQCTTGGQKMAANADLPEGMRLGLTGIVEKQVTAMFNAQPNIDVVAHLSEEWVPGYKEKQSVYAQATGYKDLTETNIDSLWSVTRNIAYLGFVVVMIVIGFMIMFRSKIGGQMMVTVGNSIPKVIVGLILVTFSFAIAGLILDIAGILMGIVSGILDSGVPVHNIFKLLGGTLGIGGGTTVGDLGIAGIVLTITMALGPAGWILLALALIILAIVLFGAIKLWFALVKTYFTLLVNVVVAPLAIMAGSIPGNEAMTINIFKSMLRNALVFPLAYAIVNLPYFLVQQDNRVRFTFPETVFEGASMGDTIGPLMLALAKIIAIFVAAQAPAFTKAIIPPTASKGGADAAGAIKQGMSGIPLVGGMFK
jgi:hypothetical protein